MQYLKRVVDIVKTVGGTHITKDRHLLPKRRPILLTQIIAEPILRLLFPIIGNLFGLSKNSTNEITRKIFPKQS